MKGSTAHTIRALVVFAAVIGSFADKPKKQFKNFSPQQGQSFVPPLHFPKVPPFQLSPFTNKPNTGLDPYACLPKYLCVIQNKKGEKRTTIVHGLHPALGKAKPNVIDPATLPQVPGGTKPFPPPLVTESSDDDVFRDREFDDSFLKQQEMAETMAFIEEKRRQFMYQQGLPKQKIIPKGGEKPVDEDESKEEEEEKSQEVSKEDKEEEAEKSQEEAEEESTEVEEDASSESNAKSDAKLSKYKIKKKAFAANKKRANAFKSRMDDYEEADASDDHLATVPWDDRLRNDSDPLKPSEIYDKLVGKVLPFQLPSLTKIARNIPGMSFLTADSDEITTTTTQRPGLLKRMIKAVTGSGADPNPIKKRNGRPVRRFKRGVSPNIKLISNDASIVKQIRDPARQCRMIYKGCDLPYAHIMKMVSAGQVLIESDNEAPTTQKPAPVDPSLVHDDEADQAMRDKMAHKKSSKPIPQMLSHQASLGGKKKVAGLSVFGKNKKPTYDESDEYSMEFQNQKPKKSVASLPLLPMRYQWGKPTYKQNGRPTFTNGPPDFSGGIMNPNIYKTPVASAPVVPTTTTTERPIFAAAPLDKKNNSNAPMQLSVIKLNRTHSAHILKKKPYNPAKTRTVDAKGRPVSFNTVFSEIAGNTGGIHDFFDRISGAFGGDGPKERGRELTSTFPGSNGEVVERPERHPYQYSAHVKPTAFPSDPVPDNIGGDNEDAESAERDDEDGSEEDEENNEEGEGDDDGEDEEEGDEEEEEDIADEVGDGQAAGASHHQEHQKHTQQHQEQQEQEQEQQQPELGPAALTLDSNEDPLSASLNIKKPVKGDKNKPTPQQEEDEEEDEEGAEENGEENDEEEMDLPENVPPFIRQSMIEEYKKKKLEKEQGGGDEDEEQDDQEQQQGRPQNQHGGPQHGGGGSQYGGGRPSGGGLLSALGIRPAQGADQSGGGSQYGGGGPQYGGGGSQYGGGGGPQYGGEGPQHGGGRPSGGGLLGSFGGRPSQGGQSGGGQSGGGGLFSFLG